jgi:L-threonylcarbamoyladenylate synthase
MAKLNVDQAPDHGVLLAADPAGIAMAARILRQSGIVAIPTDTVYGLAASVSHPEAIARLFDLKRRPASKAIPILIDEMQRVPLIARFLPPVAEVLAARFWPGALTLILPALDGLPVQVVSFDEYGHATVAVRVPDHSIARAVLAASGGALAVTSANISGRSPVLDARSIAKSGLNVRAIVDGGPATGGVASTIVSASEFTARIVREGAIPGSAIEEVLRLAGFAAPSTSSSAV